CLCLHNPTQQGFALRLHHPYASQVGPFTFGVEIIKVLLIINQPVATPLNPPMSLVQRLLPLMMYLLELSSQSLLYHCDYLLMHRTLVSFESQHVIGSHLGDAVGNLGLATHSIN